MIPFIYEKSEKNKEETLPLFIEKPSYYEPPITQEDQEEEPHIIIIDIF